MQDDSGEQGGRWEEQEERPGDQRGHPDEIGGAGASPGPGRPGSEPAAPYGRLASLDRRFLAAFIDGIVALAAGFVPVIGWLLAMTYWLVRDGLETEIMDQRSLGKKLLKIRPVRLDGAPTDVTDSIRRSWMFCPTGIIQYLGVGLGIGLLLAVPLAIVWLMLAGIEIYLVLTDPEGRRLGDRIAATVVIQTDR